VAVPPAAGSAGLSALSIVAAPDTGTLIELRVLGDEPIPLELSVTHQAITPPMAELMGALPRWTDVTPLAIHRRRVSY